MDPRHSDAAAMGTDLQNSAQTAVHLTSGGPLLPTDAELGLTGGFHAPNDSLQMELWSVDDQNGDSCWPFMPFLSQLAQLETLPQNFDFFNLE